MHDTRGAAYVEFLIAFLPLLLLFSGIWQFGRIFTVRILCAHAANSGARSAAVLIAEPEQNGVVDHHITAEKREQIAIAVYAAIAPAIVNDWISSVDIEFPGDAGAAAPDLEPTAPDFSLQPPKMVNVRVLARYRCNLPLVDLLMCEHADAAGWTFPIRAEGSFPYQAARYAYDPPTPQKPNDYDTVNSGKPGGHK